MSPIAQVGVVLFGAGGVWLSMGTRWRRYAPLLGIAGQPFWFWAAWESRQWGVFLVTVIYTAAWAHGIYRHWIELWLKRGEPWGGVPPLSRLPHVDQEFAEEVKTMPVAELRRRVLIGHDWIGHCAHCLDGLGLEGVDGARLPRDIRRIVERLLKTQSPGSSAEIPRFCTVAKVETVAKWQSGGKS
jgi:hypothetical protein